MDADALRRLCRGFNGAVEEPPFFKVGGKVFAIAPLDGKPPQRLGLKCDPDLAQVLRATYPAITPGYHNRRHWNTVTLDGSLGADFVRDLLEDSDDLVVSALSKRVQRELRWSPSGQDGKGMTAQRHPLASAVRGRVCRPMARVCSTVAPGSTPAEGSARSSTIQRLHRGGGAAERRLNESTTHPPSSATWSSSVVAASNSSG